MQETPLSENRSPGVIGALQEFLRLEAASGILLVIAKRLLLWINDGLMTVFFLLVGLELKREIVRGELPDPSRAALSAS